MNAVDLLRDTAKELPAIPAETKKLRIWFCKYKTLQPLQHLAHLDELVIAGLPDADIGYLGKLKQLKHLSILGFAKVKSIDFLSQLIALESLSLSTPPSWDASSRKITVDSITPIALLPRLKHLELFGVMDAQHSLQPLEQCAMLRTARFNQYPAQTVSEFYQATGADNQANPPGHFE